MRDFSRARYRIVDTQIARRGINDPYILQAMRRVPREAFVNPGLEEFAYEDSPLSIGEGQTISQPYIVARMIEAAGLMPGETALDVGAGSGYAAALASLIAKQVFPISAMARLAKPPVSDCSNLATTTSICVLVTAQRCPGAEGRVDHGWPPGDARRP